MKQKLIAAGAIGLMFMAGPVLAAQELEDEELDRLSAAGEPTVIHAEGDNSPVVLTDQTKFLLDFPVPRAQDGIRALTVQNVVGELQLLINLNVLSAANNVAGTDQRNFSAQSWGSTLPDPDTVKTVDAKAPCSVAGACIGGDAGDAGDAAAAAAPGGPGGKVGGNAAAAAAEGGNSTGGNGAPLIAKGGVPGEVSPAASASGDVILKTEGESSPVIFDNSPEFLLQFGASQAQADLSALFVGNIVGRSQMAFNLNIAAATLNLIPGTSDPFTTPIGGDTGPGTVKQVNTGVQFRGTPLVGASGVEGTFSTTINHQNQ